MKIDFKALAAGVIAAIVVALIAHAHPGAAKEKAGGIAPSSFLGGDAAARYA